LAELKGGVALYEYGERVIHFNRGTGTFIRYLANDEAIILLDETNEEEKLSLIFIRPIK
jgi:streptomycin 6-kinase